MLDGPPSLLIISDSDLCWLVWTEAACGFGITIQSVLSSHKMHFRSSSYQHADFELVFVFEWTPRGSSNWSRRKRRELWRRKKLL
nr:hypothetical protein CFP56_38675 [Quercus suber]